MVARQGSAHHGTRRTWTTPPPVCGAVLRGGRFWGLGGGRQGRCPPRGRLTSVQADSLSSPPCRSRGRDRRRLNKAVRLRVGKSHDGATEQQSQPAALAQRPSAGCGHAHGRPAGVTPRRWSVGWSAWWGGRGGVRRGARLTSVPADRLSSPSRKSRGRDRRRLNKAVRLRVVKSHGGAAG